MTRAEAIAILKKLIEAMQGHVTVLPTPERIAAIRLAISSLETDEAYQLEYENPTTKNDLGFDLISRNEVLNRLASIAKVKAKSDAQKSLMGRCLFMVENMPSVTPQPCEDAISRQALLNATVNKNSIWNKITDSKGENLETIISKLPSVTPQEPKTGHCKDCKYFEYDSVAKVDGIPLIVAHEICKRWGDGCKTREDGYCFLFQPQESEDKG